MNKINILGLGPGSLEYTLPVVLRKVKESDVVIGGRRHIEGLGEYAQNKEYCYITADLQSVLDFIRENREKKISLILSGDTGFYSMLNFMKKHFEREELEVIPGISSIQYMFAKISSYWHDAFVSSLHGKTIDYVSKLKEFGKAGFLTDKKNTPQEIARNLVEAGLEKTTVFVGENLSYENEKIFEMKALEMMNFEYEFKMNVVLLFLKK